MGGGVLGSWWMMSSDGAQSECDSSSGDSDSSYFRWLLFSYDYDWLLFTIMHSFY